MMEVNESSESESEESNSNEISIHNLHQYFEKEDFEDGFITAKTLNNLAAYLLKSGNPVEAIPFLEKALEADNKFLLASRNLQNACSMAVDRWHFTMLNDAGRNCAFNQAIRKKVMQGYDTVLDLGTGTGLLSLYARDAGAQKVYACEVCPVMCDIAKQVLKRNKADDVELICTVSYELNVPTDIPEKVKLIVAEIFDSALFGELVIPTLIDAHLRLLQTNGRGVIIPMRASVFVAAVESNYIRFRSSLLFGKSHGIGSLNFENTIVIPDENYYDTENLENVQVNYITEPKAIFHIDFNDLNSLYTYIEDGVKSILESHCRYDGIIDGIVAWFTLNLDDEISLDSSQGKSGWQLAVFPTCPLNVKSGDIVKITVETSARILKCSCDLNDKTMEGNQNFTYHLPRDVITFLNDTEYMAALIDQAKAKKNENISTVMDTSPFPIYGLTLLKENINCKTLFNQTENKDLQSFIQHILEKNNIDGKIEFTSDSSLIHGPVDSIYVHSFDTKGELLDWGELSYKEAYSSLVRSTEAILPNRIDLYGQLVYSNELSNIVSVKDCNLQGSKCSSNTSENSGTSNNEDCKYVVAEYINRFKMNQVFDLNSSLYNYTALSEPKYLTTMDGSIMKDTIVNFGEIDLEKNVPNALICWYKVFLNDFGLETKRDDSFMNHTAIVFEDEQQDKIKEGVDVRVKVEQMYDMLRINVV